MEANVPQSNRPVQQTAQDVVLSGVNQQLQYPLDYVTQEILKQFVNTAYPVGSIYMNVTNSANPSTILGVGVWTAIEGYVVAGYKSGDTNFGTAGATVGSATHTLTEAEMPAHTHSGTQNNTGGGFNNGYGSGPYTPGNTGSTGGGTAHNNIQPTLTAYVWQRTS